MLRESKLILGNQSGRGASRCPAHDRHSFADRPSLLFELDLRDKTLRK